MGLLDIDELTQVDKNNRRLIDQATDDIQDLHNVIQVYQHRDKKLWEMFGGVYEEYWILFGKHIEYSQKFNFIANKALF